MPFVRRDGLGYHASPHVSPRVATVPIPAISPTVDGRLRFPIYRSVIAVFWTQAISAFSPLRTRGRFYGPIDH